MKKESNSSKIRNEGNVFFKQFNPKQSVVKNENCIHQAILKYNRALKLANVIEDIYKAQKNLGLCYEKMITLLGFPKIKQSKTEQYLFLLWDMCDNYSKALLNGYKSTAYNELYNKIKEMIVVHIRNLADNKNISHIQKIASYFINFKEMYYHFIGIITRIYFNLGYHFYQSKEYPKARGILYNVIEIIKSNYNKKTIDNINKDVKEIYKDINESCIFYLQRIKVEHLMQEGDKYFNLSINQSESIDMEYIYFSLEKYRAAYNCFQHPENNDNNKTDVSSCNSNNEQYKQDDIELEAIWLNSLAKISYKIWKNKEKARAMYTLCIQLGESLSPKNVSEEKWFINAQRDLEILNKEFEASKNLKEEEDEKRIKEKYKKLFDELLEKEKDTQRANYFKYIFDKYPYKGYSPICNISDEYCKDKQQFLRKLSYGYHPDKYPKNTEDQKLKYLIIQEISKTINLFYTEQKQ